MEAFVVCAMWESYSFLDERIAIYPESSEADRRDRLCVGLSRFAVTLCELY